MYKNTFATLQEDRLAVILFAGSLLVLTSGCGVVSSSMNAEGTRYFQQGNSAAAINRFEQAIATNPKDPDSYYNLGSAFHHLANSGADSSYWGQAENYYVQSLDRDPTHGEAYRGLAVLLMEQNRTDQAVTLLEGWRDRQPFMPNPKIELARLHEELGDRRSAEENLLNALAVDASNPRARAALGKIREDQGDIHQALSDYTASLACNPRQPELQARVAALAASVTPPPVVAPPPPPRTVALPPQTISY
ncbi:MAG TPA: tetratricopeptide repeat protein [Pirellulales bacterium]|nr:tetratricopeptide repeat protein [Pirellulales bacterium]